MNKRTPNRGYMMLAAMLPIAAGLAVPMQTPMGVKLGWKRRAEPKHDDAAAVAAAQAKRERKGAKLHKAVAAGGIGKVAKG